MTNEKLQKTIEHSHSRDLRKIYKKISKPVEWNGKSFESGAALGRYLKLDQSSVVSQYIKNKSKLKGFVPKFIKKDNEL